MIGTLRQILQGAFERVGNVAMAWLPPLIAAVIILAVTIILAVFARWLVLRLVKAPGIERFLAQSGFASLVSRSGRVRATRIAGTAAYWLIILAGALTALNVFGSAGTTRIVEGAVVLMPKLVTAAVIVLGGMWVGRYAGRSALVWACNEGLPHGRALAGLVRIVVVTVAIAAAADHLQFAPAVFLALAGLIAGGAVLAASIAIGLGVHRAVARHFEGEETEPAPSSLWNHL